MKVVLTSKQEITAKSGQKYFIYRGVASTGSTVELFLNEEQNSRFAIPDSSIASRSEFSELFSSLPQIEVEYNQRGRVENVEV